MATTMEQYHGVGRRKTSVARVYLREAGTGDWRINGKPLETYFARHTHQSHASEPLDVTDLADSFDVHVTADGGGLTGQAGAIRLGVARALLQYDEDLRGVLRDHGMLTRDPRMVERKKPGQPKARKQFQFSKR